MHRMQLVVWRLFRSLAVVLAATGFVLLPLIGNAETGHAHAGIIRTADCSSGYGSAMMGHHTAQPSDSGDVDLCSHGKAPKAACCLGAPCSMVQIVALMAVAIPLPSLTVGIKPLSASATGQGLRPAPSLRPPRQFI